jgi:hypothetical protein
MKAPDSILFSEVKGIWSISLEMSNKSQLSLDLDLVADTPCAWQEVCS